jgi:hypothetical protein
LWSNDHAEWLNALEGACTYENPAWKTEYSMSVAHLFRLRCLSLAHDGAVPP